MHLTDLALTHLNFTFHQDTEYRYRTIDNKSSFFQCVILTYYIRVIHQETVDNNLGPDRLAGPKALDPNYCRQSFDYTTFVWKS